MDQIFICLVKNLSINPFALIAISSLIIALMSYLLNLNIKRSNDIKVIHKRIDKKTDHINKHWNQIIRIEQEIKDNEELNNTKFNNLGSQIEESLSNMCKLDDTLGSVNENIAAIGTKVDFIYDTIYKK